MRRKAGAASLSSHNHHSQCGKIVTVWEVYEQIPEGCRGLLFLSVISGGAYFSDDSEGLMDWLASMPFKKSERRVRVGSERWCTR